MYPNKHSNIINLRTITIYPSLFMFARSWGHHVNLLTRVQVSLFVSTSTRPSKGHLEAQNIEEKKQM